MIYPRLIYDYLELSSQSYPDKKALISEENEITYSQLQHATDVLAYELINLGIKRHDRVIIFIDNSIETVISIYGILKAGAVFVTLNGSVKSQNLRYILEDSGAHVLITHTNKARVVDKACEDLKEHPKIIWIGKNNEISSKLSNISYQWESLNLYRNNLSENIKAQFPKVIDLDLAALIYTSGSTGKSKGVMCPHKSMVSAAQSIIQYLKNTPDDIIINILPLSFDYGLFQVLMSIMFGGTVVIEKTFIYTHKILKNIEKYRVTGFPIVPTVIAMLLKLDNISRYDFGSLRYITNTGAALPVEHIKQLRKILPNIKFYSMFGLTECKRILYLPPDEIDKRPRSVGKAMPNCEVFVVDEHGNEVEHGEVGELIVRGSNLMNGYWNSPELTKQWYKQGKFPGEKLLYTGDYFKKDEEAFLYFVGRKDEMIKCKGERVSPREIEDIICQIDCVVEVAVIGVDDEIAGQAIKAFVVVSQGRTLSENDIKKYCTQNLENFKVPSYIIFIDHLPKTPNNKIDKKILKTLN